MKRRRYPDAGYTLLELMVAMSLLAAIGMIALPRYRVYLDQGKAAACLANRRNIEMDEQEAYLGSNQASLAIAAQYRCPSGGTYVWLVSDPAAAGYPRVICSLHGPATIPPAEAPAEALFASEFDSTDGLKYLQGKWALKDGALVNKGTGEHRLAFGDTAWTDYTTTVRTTLDKGDGYGIYYRADGEQAITGYCFQYDPGYGKGEFLVRKVVNGKETAPIQRVKMPDGFPVYDQSHEISVSVAGDRHVIRIDGETVLDFADASFSSGAAGLRTWSKSTAAFESATVMPAGS
jgi:prepilin-type N-terminal cleavage/methylation domain-containing protein